MFLNLIGTSQKSEKTIRKGGFLFEVTNCDLKFWVGVTIRGTFLEIRGGRKLRPPLKIIFFGFSLSVF